MLIDAAHPEEVRVAVVDKNRVEDFDFESEARKPLRGNIYLARVTRVEPSLQAAFVEYGGNRHGFLAFSEIHPDYYQIPVSDREALQAAEAEEAALAHELELLHRTGDLDEDDDQDGDDDNQDGDHQEVNDEDSNDGGKIDAPQDDDVREDTAPSREDGDQGDDANDDADENTVTTQDTNHSDDDDTESNSVDEEEEEEGDDHDDDASDKTDDASSDDTQTAEKDDPEGDRVIDLADEEQPSVDFSIDAVPAGLATTNIVLGDLNVEDDIDEDDSRADDNRTDDSGDNEAGDDDAGDQAEGNDDPSSNEDKISPEQKAAREAAKARSVLFERYKEAKRKRVRLLRNYKIQEVIKPRQIILIQVVKEERGNKGAALTTYLSLAGRYCVLMPNTARGGGISRKIPSAMDRRRLRRIVDDLDVPQGMGLIIRTAGAKRTKTEVKRDFDYLIRLWESIRTLTLESIAPCLVYEEASLIKRAIRDLYDKDIGQVIVEGETGYREAKDFMKMLMPSHAKNVQPYKGSAPVFLKYGVETQLDGMYQPSVRLKSGGYIVIHQTEALVAIDVNSGRATRERNIEQTALKTNIEAAQEAARQFRLRDLAGLVVIDFIDMEESRHNRMVEKKFKDAIKNDRARIQVGRISSFGLLELSRQRRRSGIVDGTTHSCPTCNGAGNVRSPEMAAIRILRAIEGEAISGRVGKILCKTSLDVCLFILNNSRDWLQRIEQTHGVTLEILADPEKSGDIYELEKSGSPSQRKRPSVIKADQAALIDPDEDDVTEKSEARDTSDDDTEEPKRKRRRRRRKKDATPRDTNDAGNSDDGANGSSGAGKTTNDADDANASELSADDASVNDGEDGEKPKRRRRRGKRGGRRNRRGADGAAETNADDASIDASATKNGADTQETSPIQEQAPQSTETTDTKASSETGASSSTAKAKGKSAAKKRSTPSITPEEKSGNGAAPAKTRGNATDNIAPTEKAPDLVASTPVTDAGQSASSGEKKPKKDAKRGWWQRVAGG